MPSHCDHLVSAFTAGLVPIQDSNKESYRKRDWTAVGGNRSQTGNNTSAIGNSSRGAAGKQQGVGYLRGNVSNPGKAFEEAL